MGLHVFVMGDSFEPHGYVHVREHSAVALAKFTFGNIAIRTAIRADYSKYWNLFVEKENVTTNPSPGSDAAVTSMPILEHRRATR